MKIAYFNANLRRGQDGVTRVMYKMFEGALDRGHRAIAITSTLPEMEDMVIPMFSVPSVTLPLQKNYRIAFPGYSAFEKTLSAFKPDVLHINSPCTLGFAAVKYGQHTGIPVVATYHTHFPTYPRYYKLRKFENLTWKVTRHLYNTIDRTFVPTRPILEELEQQDIHRLEYLPNGVDTELFHRSRRSELWRKRFGNGAKPIVLFVSRLVWEKDLRVLVEAYRRLREDHKDFEMVIVGDGHARREFELLMPGAHFLGYQSGVALAECYASSDIFVFPSTTETFGLVTLEAMASGLAPVAAKIGGACELIEECHSGLFSEPFNGKHMAEQISRLLDNIDYRLLLGKNAFRRAQLYAWNSILDKLFASYTSVIRSKPSKAAKCAA